MSVKATARNLAQLSLATSIVLLSFSAHTQSAQAYSFRALTDLTGDGVFNDTDYDLYSKGTDRVFTTKGVIESRIGNNNSDAGVWESGMYTSTYTANGSTYNNAINAGSERGHTWTKGVAQQFKLTYDGKDLVYTIAGQTSTQSIAGVTDLLLRTRAGGQASSLNLSNMSLFDNLGTSMATWANQGSSTLSSTADIDYLRIADLKPGFTLTGDATMNWTGTRPNGSNLAFQLKIGSIPQTMIQKTPEPGAIGAFAIVGVLALRKRLKK